jgi:hypothetical protein
MVARFKLFKLEATINSQAYSTYFLAPPDHYPSTIATAAGIEEVVSGSIEAEMPVTKVEEILRSPLGTRKQVSVKVGTKTKRVKILISASNADTFDDAVKGDSYKGGTVVGSIEPRKASFQ